MSMYFEHESTSDTIWRYKGGQPSINAIKKICGFNHFNSRNNSNSNNSNSNNNNNSSNHYNQTLFILSVNATSLLGSLIN